MRTVLHCLPPRDWTEPGFMGLGTIYTAIPVTNAVPAVVAAAPGIVTLKDLPRSPAGPGDGLLRLEHHAHTDRASTDVDRQHRTHVGHRQRIDLRQPAGERRTDRVGRVMVVDVVHGERRAAVADDLDDLIHHRGVSSRYRADPL
jgi:hypothetical protein